MKKKLLILFALLFSLGSNAQGEFILTIQLPSGVTSTNFTVNANNNVDYTWETIPAGMSGIGTFTNINGTLNNITSLPDGALIRFSISPTYLNRISASSSVKGYYQTLEQWGTVNWTSMQSMFSSASNLIITATDIPNLINCTTLKSMFAGCSSLSSVPNINSWNTSNIENMENTFSGSIFNQDLNNWDISNVTTLRQMFDNNSSFNGDVTTWDVSNTMDMNQIFADATNFNQNISGWNVSNVTDMAYMLQYTAFDHNLGGWNMSSVTTADAMLNGSSMSIINYDNTLIGWSPQTLQNGVNLGAFQLTYCSGETARNSIINDFGWTFTGDALDCGASISENNNSVISLFPNPAQDQLNIEIQNTGNFQLYNVIGELIYSYQLNQGINTLNISTLNPNVYLIFDTTTGTYQKFIKE